MAAPICRHFFVANALPGRYSVNLQHDGWFDIIFEASNRRGAAFFCFIKAPENLDQRTKKRLNDMIEFFDLNAPRLVKKRNEIAEAVMDCIAKGDVAKARELANRFRPHSLVAKQILQDKGWTPPDESDDIDGLLEDILTELEILQRSLGPPSTRNATTTERELWWALAALWRDPPHGDPESVQAYLEADGVLDYVQPLHDPFATA